MQIDLWIDDYSNCGTKIKTSAIKAHLKKLQEKYPERNYELIRTKRIWFIVEGEAN
jgi:chromosome segregation and condensation protein ScpB